LKRVADALGEYERAYAVNHRESGLQIVKERSAHLIEHLGELMAVDLTPDKILDYMTTRKREGVSNRTVNMEIEVLSRAMEMNFEGVKNLEEARDVGRALPDEEEERLIGAAARSHSPVLHMALRIALATGMRHDEIRLLQMFQIDFEQKHFVVQGQDRGRRRARDSFRARARSRAQNVLESLRAEIRRGDAAGLVFVPVLESQSDARSHPPDHQLEAGLGVGAEGSRGHMPVPRSAAHLLHKDGGGGRSRVHHESYNGTSERTHAGTIQPHSDEGQAGSNSGGGSSDGGGSTANSGKSRQTIPTTGRFRQ